VDRAAPVPQFAGRTFQRWAREHRSPPAARHVAYFHGCGVNWYEPRLGEMAVALLEHVGCDVAVPEGQACCGLPLQSNGMFGAARRTVRRMARRLAPSVRSGRVLVGTSTSCTLMLKREAAEILALEADPDLRLVRDAILDVCEYLLALHDEDDLRPAFATPVPLTVTYHAPCQQQGHGIGKPALDLLALVPQLRVIEHDVACCGIAGTYGLKHEKHQIALDVGAPLWRQVAAAGPDLVVCDSETCRWQIEQATGVHAVHPVELLHRAAGLG
jgi:glycerol-3-phosphate dehydrogenase subunit C